MWLKFKHVKGIAMISREMLKRQKKHIERHDILKEWYGNKVSSVEIAAHGEKVRKISDVLSELNKEFVNEENGNYLKISGNWKTIAGSVLSNYTTPYSLEDGVLTLMVKHSALLKELTDSCDIILKKIQETVGVDNCQKVELKCTQNRFNRFTSKKK